MDKLNEEIRLLIAFLISIFIIFIFSKFQSSKYSQYKNQFQKTETTQEEEIIQEGENFEFENNTYFIKIDKRNGYIKEIGLKKFLRKDEEIFDLNEGTIFFLNPEFLGGNGFEIERIGNDILLINQLNRIKISKRYKIPENYYIFDYQEKILNNTNKDKEFNEFEIEIMKINIENFKSQRGYVPPKIITGINRMPIFVDPFRLKEEKIYKNCRWVGISLRYSLIFVYLPEKSLISLKPDGKFINVKLRCEKFILKKGEGKKYQFKFYAGPSDYFVARNYIKEDIFGKGFFVVIGRFLFSILNGIHKVIPNWGWSIIILTFIIKILFFPLTRKSLYSMKQLQKLRPYLQDVQKKYKDNPYQLQKELMNIYKEYNINPFAGCLPTIIQIPIFIGFFLALRNSIFLRGASFILWIKDLSMPDTIFVIRGFPINILPILMTITSYFQQKLTPQTEPGQKSLTIIMPLIFLFILYNFSSGLLLYWVTMNIGSLIEQFFVSKNFPKIHKRQKIC
ncbi:MAG: membrane protein insertase YidC [Candidatus Omnitrophica bacterium]|nr:membrane protein insertase YidC [Candidatus Omnitrophota bacterium]